MYALKKLISECYKHGVVKETVLCSRFASHRPPKKQKRDPGVGLRKSLFPDEVTAFDDLEDEGIETDFMNAGTTYSEHVEELELLKEREKYMIVRQKYFKHKLPNFLTWNDTEQIRYLHNTNPQEWTLDKLSEGFPALPETIAKICKTTWMKKNEAKIKNHDNSVQKNWELFKANQLQDLPPDLVQHLNKFTNRNLNLSNVQVPTDKSKKTFTVTTKASGEFSEIITSYEKLKKKREESFNKERHDPVRNSMKKQYGSETYMINSGKQSDKKVVTLETLQKDIEKNVATGKKVKEGDLIILSQLKDAKEKKNDPIIQNEQDKIVELLENKYTSSQVGTDVRSTNVNVSYFNYPEKIVIPKDKLKRGYTYKLNDCYYDDDGEFLFRVPGMY